MVSIRKVTKDNFHETAKLEVHPHQKTFVAENWYSIIEASFEETYHSLVYTRIICRLATQCTVWIQMMENFG